MAKNKDLYNILGIKKDATEDEIKSAYRKMCLKWHPDKWANHSEEERKNAEEEFKKISEAYEILSDKEKKSNYDMFGTTDFGEGMGHGFSMNMDDIMSEFMNANPFGGFGGFRYREKRSYKGSDKKLKINVSIEDIFYGRSKTVTYEVERPCHVCGGKGSQSGESGQCPYCGGTGFITKTQHFGGGMVSQSQPCPYCGGTGQYIKDPCGKCHGTGVEIMRVERDFKVPTVDKLNAMFKISGEGNSCHNNKGTNGDLYFTFAIRQEEDSPYYIDEDSPYNIMTDINVDAFDCILGCEKLVNTIDGKTLKFKVPKGTRDGYKFVCNGRGLPHSNGARGQFIVRVVMTMPSVTDAQADKIRKILKK